MTELPTNAVAHVITASNRASAGMYEDASGEFLEQTLAAWGFAVTRTVLPDDRDALRDALTEAVHRGADLVLTTGGTGLSPSDCTPEATAEVIERPAPGIADAIRNYGAAGFPAAVLSRGIAGVAGHTLIVNLPGSRGGVRDGVAVLEPLIGHIVDQLRGGDHPRPTEST